MSRSNAKIKSLTALESTLLRHYVREGATEDRLGRAARRAHITEKYALTLLKRPHVQVELAQRKLILYSEQAKIDAADINRSVEETDVLCRDTERRAMHRLNALIETDPKDLKAAHTIHMEVLKLALVVAGTIRSGRNGTERLAPPDGGGPGGQGSQVPGSFFARGMVGAGDAAPIFGAASEAPVNELKNEKVNKDETPAHRDGTAMNGAQPEETLETLEVEVKRTSKE